MPDDIRIAGGTHTIPTGEYRDIVIRNANGGEPANVTIADNVTCRTLTVTLHESSTVSGHIAALKWRGRDYDGAWTVPPNRRNVVKIGRGFRAGGGSGRAAVFVLGSTVYAHDITVFDMLTPSERAYKVQGVYIADSATVRGQTQLTTCTIHGVNISAAVFKADAGHECRVNVSGDKCGALVDISTNSKQSGEGWESFANLIHCSGVNMGSPRDDFEAGCFAVQTYGSLNDIVTINGFHAAKPCRELIRFDSPSGTPLIHTTSLSINVNGPISGPVESLYNRTGGSNTVHRGVKVHTWPPVTLVPTGEPGDAKREIVHKHNGQTDPTIIPTPRPFDNLSGEMVSVTVASDTNFSSSGTPLLTFHTIRLPKEWVE